MRDIERLPKWAQSLIREKDNKISWLKEEMENLKKAHALLLDRNWITIHNPVDGNGPEIRDLFMLDTNCAKTVCSISKGDVLLIGRSERE
jgi:hypothetical protein